MVAQRFDASQLQVKPLQVQEGSPTIQAMGIQASPEPSASVTPSPVVKPVAPGGLA